MPLDLAAIPIVDNHCHSLLREQPPDDDAFRIHLTESTFPEIARDHVPTSLFYQWTLRELAVLLDCDATPAAVHAARRDRGVEWLTREIVERGAIVECRQQTAQFEVRARDIFISAPDGSTPTKESAARARAASPCTARS